MTNNKYILGFGLGIAIGIILRTSGLTVNDVMFWNIVIPAAFISGLIYKKIK